MLHILYMLSLQEKWELLHVLGVGKNAVNIYTSSLYSKLQ